MKNRSRLWHKGITVLMIGLIVFVAGELFLRISGIWVGRHSDTMFKVMQYDEILGWRMKPNVSTKIDLVDVEAIPVHGNVFGFWDREFSLQKKEKSYRIVLLGDSFTWGLGVREEQRFSNVLEERHANWDILNFGMPGYGVDQSLLVWETLAKRYHPLLVVLTIYKNDYVDNMSVVNDGRSKPYYILKEDGTLELVGVPVGSDSFWQHGIFNQIAPPYASFFQNPVEKRSRLLYWAVKNLDLVRLGYTMMKGHSRRRLQNKISEAKAPLKGQQGESPLNDLQRLEVKLMDALIRRLDEEVRSQGSQFVVVFAGDATREFEEQMHLLEKAKISYWDVTTTVLQGALAGDPAKSVYLKYSGHWTPDANLAVADLLESRIRDESLAHPLGQE